MTKQVSEKIKILNICMMFILVAYHVGRMRYPILEDIACVTNCYFFGISAYFIFSKMDEYGYKKILRKRIMTIAIPYFCWNLLTYLIFIALNGLNGVTIKTFLSGVLWVSICSPSWYLKFLFFFVVLSGGLALVYKRKYAAMLVIPCSVAVSFISMYLNIQGKPLSLPFFGVVDIRIMAYFPAFAIGGYIGTKGKECLSVLRKWQPILIVVFAGLIYAAFKSESIYIKYMIYYVSPLVLWESLPDKMFGHIKLIDFFARPVLFVNMFHYVIIACFRWSFEGFLLPGRLAIWSYIFDIIFVCYATYYVMRTLLPRTLKVITGNR